MDNQIPATGGASAVVREREAGGRFPNVGDLVQETWAEFMDAIGPYLMGMLGLVVGYLIVGIAFTVVFGGLLAAVIVAVTALSAISEQLGSAVGPVVGLLSVAVNLVFGALVVVGSVALTAPLNASFLRAVAAHQRGEEELQVASAFSTITQDLPQVIGIGALVGVVSFVALLLCVFPVVLVPLFLGFAIPMVALHGMPAMHAARTNVEHVRDHLQDHAILALVTFALNSVAGLVPILGPAFVMAFSVRAYRKIFGDGEAPQLALLEDGGTA